MAEEADQELLDTEINFGDDDDAELGTPSPESENGDDGAEGEGADEARSRDSRESAPAKPANRWDAMKAALSRVGDGKQVRLPGEPGETDEEQDEESGDDTPDEQKGEKPKPDAQEKPASEKGKPNESERPADSSRQVFTITDADGDEAELEWPEGATISFQADGQKVVAKNLGELVTFAQKGVHADRRLSEMGRERAQHQSRATQLEKQVQEKDAEVQTAEDLILKAVFDDTAREQLQKELEAYRDPKVRDTVRKGLAASEELESRKRQDQERTTATNEQLVTRFREQVASQIKSELEAEDDEGNAKYAYLTADDVPQVQQRFLDNYTAILQQTTEQYRREAPGVGLTQEQADAEARKFAVTYLTEDNLRQVAQEIEAHYRERAERVTGRRADSPTPGAKAPNGREAAADAERHNNHVKRKLEQRNKTPRPLRGGSDPSGGTREVSTEGMTFAQRMDLMRRTLREA